MAEDLEEIVLDGKKVITIGAAVVRDDGKIDSNRFKDFQYVREAAYLKHLVEEYLKGNGGGSLLDYLSAVKGKKMKKIVGFGSTEFDLSIYARIYYDRTRAAIISNGRGAGFDQRACEFAAMHGIDDIDWAREYIIAHELVHAHGIGSEKRTEMALYRHFINMAKNAENPKEKAKYQKLAKVAYERAKGKSAAKKAA